MDALRIGLEDELGAVRIRQQPPMRRRPILLRDRVLRRLGNRIFTTIDDMPIRKRP